MATTPFQRTFGTSIWGGIFVHSLANTGSSTSSGSANLRIPNRLISASGASTSIGSISARRILGFVASGSSTSVGSVSAVRTLRFTASGSSTSNGSSLIYLIKPASASGASISSGSVSAVRILRFTTSGASTTAGSVAAKVDRRISGSGSSTSAGSVSALLQHILNASGASTATGSVDVHRNLVITGSGASVSVGSATALQVGQAVIKPDGVITSTNITSPTHTAVDDSPDLPDAEWLDPTNPASATMIQFSFESVPLSVDEELIPGADRQKFRILLKAP